MHRDAAGMATEIPMMSFEAMGNEIRIKEVNDIIATNVLISHQTGAKSIALSLHTIEFIKKESSPIAVHAMYKQVPVFHAKRRMKIRVILIWGLNLIGTFEMPWERN